MLRAANVFSPTIVSLLSIAFVVKKPVHDPQKAKPLSVAVIKFVFVGTLTGMAGILEILNWPLVTVIIWVLDPISGAVKANVPTSFWFARSAVVNVTIPSAPRK